MNKCPEATFQLKKGKMYSLTHSHTQFYIMNYHVFKIVTTICKIERTCTKKEKKTMQLKRKRRGKVIDACEK